MDSSGKMVTWTFDFAQIWATQIWVEKQAEKKRPSLDLDTGFLKTTKFKTQPNYNQQLRAN